MKLRIIILLILLLILSLPLSLWLWWKISDEKIVNVFVLDKTVLDQSTQEHNAFFWYLKNEKITKQNGIAYNPVLDYFGFFPDGKGKYAIFDLENKTQNQIDSLANFYDMAYFTDLYGIYKNEWFHEYPQFQQPKTIEAPTNRSPLIYGGLTQKELDFLKQMKSKKKLIINEFNIIASPTSELIRKQYEAEFKIQWSGWVGRYFENLDTAINKELPKWLVKNYMEQNNNSWPFTKSGIAFVKNNERVVILQNQTHLYTEVPQIVTSNSNSEYYNVPSKIKYSFWFDVCSTDSSNQIISSYSIESNAKGDSILAANKIPKSFPAIIMHNKEYSYYYFAGDFADEPISLKLAEFKYIQYFKFLFYDSSVLERKSFFWEFYIPLISKIMDDYSTCKNVKP